MARGCCGESTCNCALVAGDNVTITGTGSANNPLVISANVTVEGGDFEITDLPPLMTFVFYDDITGWPTRPIIPVGWGVQWINRIDTTAPPSGPGGMDLDLDVVLLAAPTP